MLSYERARRIVKGRYNRLAARPYFRSVFQAIGLGVPPANLDLPSLLPSDRHVDGLEALHLVGRNWTDEAVRRPIAILFNISPWKRGVVAEFLPGYRVAFVRFETSWRRLARSLRRHRPDVMIFWGMHMVKPAIAHARRHDIPVWRMEDGFLRSVGLGAEHVPPLSLAIDKQGIYFDSTRPSDLETLILHFDREDRSALIRRAENCIAMITAHGLSKYNAKLGERALPALPASTHRILVIGQVEDDASIVYGSAERYTNNDLVRFARQENPQAEILYKPHPDVVAGMRGTLSDPREVEHLCVLAAPEYGLHELIDASDHVYAITSLGGFEALLRGKRVTVFGAPFYAGWGLTDDRQPVARRNVRRTLQEVFAAAYILYPTYRVGDLGTDAQIEHAILSLVLEKNGATMQAAQRRAACLRVNEINLGACRTVA